MSELSLDWPLDAASLLAQAKRDSASSGELVKLIMAGTRRLDSWLIENRILPALQEKDVRALNFSLVASGHGQRTASIVPLLDGSAFACSASGRWSALDGHEALSAIQYVGFRYAPNNRWLPGFQATLQKPGASPVPVTPLEVATIWEKTTGSRPRGFATGIRDQMQAFGLRIIDSAFNTQGRLGL